MKQRLSWFLLFAGLFSLSGCAKSEPALEDYVSTLPFVENFSVLQLTDLHWSTLTDRPKQKEYLTAVISAAKLASPNGNVDLLMITGDCTLLGSKEVAKDLFDFLASFHISFGVSWGNHDRQSAYSMEWLDSLLSSYPNSLYKDLDDNVTGRSNYVISLQDSGKSKWQIYSLDSGSYEPSSTPLRYSYDHIRTDQSAWFVKEADKASNVPSLVYFHIPTREWQEVYENKSYSKVAFEKNERIWASENESDFFRTAKSHNVKGLFCGHDHSNDLTLTYEGVVLGYGVKSGKELSFGTSPTRTYVPAGTSEKKPLQLIGGSLSVLHGDGTFDLKHLYVQDDRLYTVVEETY
jgi:3',5'-cyclic AMP phosphodiesterase CpdA